MHQYQGIIDLMIADSGLIIIMIIIITLILTTNDGMSNMSQILCHL